MCLGNATQKRAGYCDSPPAGFISLFQKCLWVLNCLDFLKGAALRDQSREVQVSRLIQLSKVRSSGFLLPLPPSCCWPKPLLVVEAEIFSTQGKPAPVYFTEDRTSPTGGCTWPLFMAHGPSKLYLGTINSTTWLQTSWHHALCYSSSSFLTCPNPVLGDCSSIVCNQLYWSWAGATGHMWLCKNKGFTVKYYWKFSSPVTLATFHMLDCLMWPVAAVLVSTEDMWTSRSAALCAPLGEKLPTASLTEAGLLLLIEFPLQPSPGDSSFPVPVYFRS